MVILITIKFPFMFFKYILLLEIGIGRPPVVRVRAIFDDDVDTSHSN